MDEDKIEKTAIEAKGSQLCSEIDVGAEAGGSQAEPEVDAVTGASPGTAQACADLGLNSLEQNLIKLNIKPPGVS